MKDIEAFLRESNLHEEHKDPVEFEEIVEFSEIVLEQGCIQKKKKENFDECRFK